MLDEKILLLLDCNIYKYNYTKHCFQIRNYFDVNNDSLLEELKEILKILEKNEINYIIEKDNTITIAK
ncbi:MAG: hypothetical protein C0626_01775 [Arcobacter sp.]|uniref:hypothetical protein n=1 Tax=uncultured Arcobacter sp. TaxID=165434 RepID=UPI000CAFA26C|nr:hypothetical protein [uncultured Arcobacter sp.]PLY11322.1 MAG: hypothetical protein C0626_01775 [Arcobacter sp.]